MKVSPGKIGAVILQGSKVSLNFTVENDEGTPVKGTPFFNLKAQGKQQIYVVFEQAVIQPGEKATFNFEVKFDVPVGEAVAYFCFETDKAVCEERQVYIAGEGEAIYVAFVWHHHQAPQFYPDGSLKDEWAFIHVAKGDFYAYSGGPYKVHMETHKRIPGFIDVDHFSPSLLEQWLLFLSGKLRSSTATKEDVEGLLSFLREKIREGIVEPLGSVYAHTVLGLVLKKAKQRGLDEIAKKLIEWELREGLKIVEEALGRRPSGLWTPEMFWHMDLVDLYGSLGVRYTVLCEQHFTRAGGDKENIYEPYVVEDPISGRSVVVFFRDLKLSNWISFKVDFKNPEEADNEARRFVIELAKRREVAPGGIVTIALDGENWMIMPAYRKYAPYFLEKVLEYILESQVIRLTTLSKYLDQNPPKRVLDYIPSGSWVELSDKQWTGGAKDELWNEAMETLVYVESAYRLLEPEAERLLADPDSPLYRLFKAIAIAIDSDFYWYGELEREREFIKEWLAEARKIAGEILGNLKAREVGRTNNHAFIEIENRNLFSAKVRIVSEAKSRVDETSIIIPASSKVTLPVYVGDSNTLVRVVSGKVTLQVVGGVDGSPAPLSL